MMVLKRISVGFALAICSMLIFSLSYTRQKYELICVNQYLAIGMDCGQAFRRLDSDGYKRIQDGKQKKNIIVYQKLDSNGQELSLLRLGMTAAGQVTDVSGIPLSLKIGSKVFERPIRSKDISVALGPPDEERELADGCRSMFYPNRNLYIVVDAASGELAGLRLENNLNRHPTSIWL